MTERVQALTKTEMGYLASIRGMIARHGYPPSGAELAELHGVSKQRVNVVIQQLEDKGYVERPTGEMRTLRVLR